MKTSGFMKKLKLLDIYPKSKDEVVQKSSAGAIVSIIGILLLSYLFINEIVEFEANEFKTILSVDASSRERMMTINLRVLFMELPCEAISMDISDRLGDERIGLSEPELRKTPFIGDFFKSKSVADNVAKPFSWVFKNNNLYKMESAIWAELNLPYNILTKQQQEECIPCGELQNHPMFVNKCCRTCWSLISAYASAGVSIAKAYSSQQCLTRPTEGCLINANMKVKVTQGSFHIAVGSPHMHAGGHHHDWPANMRQVPFNTSHYISHLSFGREFPGVSSPLDGEVMIQEHMGQQQYFLQVVPTIYKSPKEEIDTNQFSMTQHYTRTNMDDEHLELPGVFFKYDISPLKISIDYLNKPISHLLLRLCAVIGGVWVVIGIVYSTVANMLGLVRTKKSE